MISVNDIRAYTRRQPFRPFRIVTDSGQTYDILYPDKALTSASRVLVGLPAVAITEQLVEVPYSSVDELRELGESRGEAASGTA